jgi:hypothetical protein
VEHKAALPLVETPAAVTAPFCASFCGPDIVARTAGDASVEYLVTAGGGREGREVGRALASGLGVHERIGVAEEVVRRLIAIEGETNRGISTGICRMIRPIATSR